MSKLAQVTLRMPPDIKKNANDFFEGCGISFNQGMLLLLRQALERGEIVLKPRYNTETIAAIKEAEDMAKHPEKYPSYNNFEELLDASLKGDD